MLALAIALGAAMLIPLVTGGSYVRLVMAPWRWGALLLGGFAVQILLEYADLPQSRWHDAGFGLLIASYVLLLGFCFGNILMKGMTVVLIGVAANAIVIAANQGMPVDIPSDWEQSGWVEPTIKHHPLDDDDRLTFLADIIVLRSPWDVVLSFGDLILAVGLVDMAFHASRKPSRRPRRRAARRAPSAPARSELEVAIDLATAGASGRDAVRLDRPFERVDEPRVVHVTRR